MSLVWQHFPMGGSGMLTLLALADYANDDGMNVYPSIAAVAKKIRTSRSQAQRWLHTLALRGYISVVGNEAGGPPGTTRHYKIHLDRLTGSTYATPTGSTYATRRVAPMRETGSTHATQSINNHHRTINTLSGKPEEGAKAATKKQALEVLNFLNLETSRKYRPVEANLKLIIARLNEGASVDDCKRVISRKTKAWGDSQVMAEYLRPSTLFNCTKFAQYVGEIDAPERATKPRNQTRTFDDIQRDRDARLKAEQEREVAGERVDL